MHDGSHNHQPKKRAQPPEQPSLHRRVMSLSGVQFQVLEALARGQLNKEIADHRGNSVRTIEAHVVEIFKKLGVESRRDAGAAFRQWKKELRSKRPSNGSNGHSLKLQSRHGGA